MHTCVHRTSYPHTQNAMQTHDPLSLTSFNNAGNPSQSYKVSHVMRDHLGPQFYVGHEISRRATEFAIFHGILILPLNFAEYYRS